MKGLDARCTCRALRRCDIDDLAGERPVAGCEGANATQAQLAGVDRTCQIRKAVPELGRCEARRAGDVTHHFR